MNADEQLSIKPEYWLNRELSKVTNPKRRQWLAEKVFAGAEGYQKFVKLMREREGAIEFNEGGAWEKEFPVFSPSELELKRRPCIGGCEKTLPPLFAPWGELIEDFPPICPKCKTRIKPKETNMSDNKPDASKDVQDILAQLEAKKQSLKADLKTTLDEAKTKLNVLLTPQLGFTFDAILSDAAFSDIVEAFKIQVRKYSVKATPAKGVKRKTKGGEVKKGGLKAMILEAMSDGKERKRPEIKAALQRLKIKTTNLYGKSGVQGLVNDGKLNQHGKGRQAVYSIAK